MLGIDNINSGDDYLNDLKAQQAEIDRETVNEIARALRNGQLKFYHIYNSNFNIDEYAFLDFKKNFENGTDPVSINLNRSYYDIETFFDPQQAPDPVKTPFGVNSIALYNDIANRVILFVYVGTNELGLKVPIKDAQAIETGVKELYQQLVKDNQTYYIDGLQIEVFVFENEARMLKSFFLTVRSFETMFLIGFNSFNFDNPYLVNRLVKLIGKDAYRYISEFGEVKKYGEKSYEWPDYTRIDILYEYKPVDQGGRGLGRSLPNFKLNTIAQHELGLNKLDLEGDFNEIYSKDIVKFVTYNMLDTLLTYKLDLKLNFVNLSFSLSNLLNSTTSASSVGRSVMYKYSNDLQLVNNENKLIRSKLYNREIFWGE